MKIYTSISELQTQARIWMQSPCKGLNSIDTLEVVNFYIGASILINNRLAELSNALGISGFRESEIVTFSPYSSTNRALATCEPNQGRIQISFKTILAYESLDLILIHELCHLVHANHSSRFWTLYEYNLKKLGLVDPEFDGWNSRLNKYDETWDNKFAFDLEHTKFRGSCDRRIAILKYKVFAKIYYEGQLIFYNKIYGCISEVLKAYSLCLNRYHLDISGLTIKSHSTKKC